MIFFLICVKSLLCISYNIFRGKSLCPVLPCVFGNRRGVATCRDLRLRASKRQVSWTTRQISGYLDPPFRYIYAQNCRMALKCPARERKEFLQRLTPNKWTERNTIGNICHQWTWRGTTWKNQKCSKTILIRTNQSYLFHMFYVVCLIILLMLVLLGHLDYFVPKK